jgi:uncharacterized iron-regulated membrane protein
VKLARLASFVHKWLALLVGVQIVFWVVSGLFFTIIPIEQIRSEHLIRPAEAARPLTLSNAPGLAQIRDARGQAPVKLTLESRPVLGDVVIAEFADAPPRLLDAATLRQVSPLDADAATAIARAHVTLAAAPERVELVESESPEYRAALPAWRVQFADGGLSVYVAANTGAVTARRSDMWRLYDTLWALHIMDWRNHEDFNHPLIIIVTAITLLSLIAGIILIPYRIRFGGGRKRTPPAAASSNG